MARCTSHRGCHADLMKPGSMGPASQAFIPVICDDEGQELPSDCAALIVPEVVQAAVVQVSDEIRGKVPDLYVSLRPGLASVDREPGLGAGGVPKSAPSRGLAPPSSFPTCQKPARGRSCVARSRRFRMARIPVMCPLSPIRRSST